MSENRAGSKADHSGLVHRSVDYGGCAETKEDQVRPISSFRNRQREEPAPDSRLLFTGEKQFPSRSTFFSRYRRCHRLFYGRPSSGKGSKRSRSRSSTPARSRWTRAWFPPEVVRGTSTKGKGEDSPGCGSRGGVGLLRTSRLGLRLQLQRWWSLASGKTRCFRCWLRWEPRGKRRGGANVRGKN